MITIDHSLASDLQYESDHERMIWSWCANETCHWIGKYFDHSSFIAEIKILRENPSFCHYEVRDGLVSIWEHPNHPSSDNARKHSYQIFLQEVVRLFCPTLTTDILFFCEDSGIESHIPIFSFQKTKGQKCILLPDPDFLGGNFFYPHDILADKKAFEQKACSAVFAGSTSGFPVTEESIRNLTHPRIRAAIRFSNCDDVKFYLPSLVQFDSEKTKDILIRMGFGKASVSWPTQFEHKFIISMDGNGATCSRLPITLRSNSVLLKYHSDSMLYYFSGLIPWLHYIPISSDEQVIDVVRIERSQPGLLSFISRQAQQFAKTYLTRYRIMQYTAQLLSLYTKTILNNGQYSLRKSGFELASLNDEAQFGGITAHIGGRGDVWQVNGRSVGVPGSGQAIEGFSIDPGIAFGLHEVQYQVAYSDGSYSDWHEGGKFAGTMGRSQPIYGFRVRLLGALSGHFVAIYSGSFVDGYKSPVLHNGEVCIAPNLAPLESMVINFMASVETDR